MQPGLDLSKHLGDHWSVCASIVSIDPRLKSLTSLTKVGWRTLRVKCWRGYIHIPVVWKWYVIPPQRILIFPHVITIATWCLSNNDSSWHKLKQSNIPPGFSNNGNATELSLISFHVLWHPVSFYLAKNIWFLLKTRLICISPRFIQPNLFPQTFKEVSYSIYIQYKSLNWINLEILSFLKFRIPEETSRQ